MGSIADNSSGGSYGYRMSKVSLNMAAACLHHELKPEGVNVLCLHPGYVKTRMTGGRGHLEVSESVKLMLSQIKNYQAKESFNFLHASGEVLEW